MSDLIPVGVGTAGVAVVDTRTGDVLISSYDGRGLGAMNWDKFGNIFQQSWQPIAEGLRDKLSGKYKYGGGYADVSAYPPQVGGAYAGVGGGQAFGGIDTTTLIIVAGIALVAFMFIKK